MKYLKKQTSKLKFNHEALKKFVYPKGHAYPPFEKHSYNFRQVHLVVVGRLKIPKSARSLILIHTASSYRLSLTGLKA